MFLRPVAALLLLSGAATPTGAAQAPTVCEGRACTSSDFWAGVTELHQLKTEFVAALRRFAESVSGSYGDEGPLLPAELDAVQRALESWDRSITAYESTARSAPNTVDVRAALGSVYLDRARIQEALRELAAAERINPRRADVHELSAMAYEAGGNSNAAVAELQQAIAIAPGD